MQKLFVEFKNTGDDIQSTAYMNELSGIAHFKEGIL